jgi:hypothetical protein
MSATAPPREQWGWIHIDFFGGKSANMWVIRCEECDEILCPPRGERGKWTHERSGKAECPEVGDTVDN